MKNNNPRVSIIMGVYNAEMIIESSIKSIEEQTYQDWELIICDDCSTDDTYEKLYEIAKKDNRIRVIKNKHNSKLAFSLNQCLAVAKGEYIARMDADDRCVKDRLQIQVDFLDSHPEIAVVGSTAFIYDDSGVKKVRMVPEFPDKSDMIYGGPFMHPTIMMRKSAYDKLNGYTVAPRTQRGQDLDLWFRFFYNGFKGYNIQEPLIYYHDSVNDYKKRTLKEAWMSTQTRYYGFRLLKFKAPYYVYVFKPIISALIPNKLRFVMHNKVK